MRLNHILPVILGLALGAVAIVPKNAHAVIVTLHWTAPGDDGTTGQAMYYELRYSYFPFDEVGYSGAIPVITGVPRPSRAGQRDSAEVIGLAPGLTYYFALRSRDAKGNWSAISNLAVSHPTVVLDVEGEGIQFSEPQPNPASHSTRFAIVMPVAGECRVEVFDMAGRRVRTLSSGWHPAGSQSLEWNLTSEVGRVVNPGLYLVRARVVDRDWTRRLAVVR